MGWLWAVATAARALGVGALAGSIAGLLAGGVGSRLAMRISAIATGPSCAGLVTENGTRCGEITADGTVFLLMFGALPFGVVGGIVYVAVRPWFARAKHSRGLAFGFLLLAVFGSTIINNGNQDFRRFAHPVANIILFAMLFPAFGRWSP